MLNIHPPAWVMAQHQRPYILLEARAGTINVCRINSWVRRLVHVAQFCMDRRTEAKALRSANKRNGLFDL